MVLVAEDKPSEFSCISTNDMDSVSYVLTLFMKGVDPQNLCDHMIILHAFNLKQKVNTTTESHIHVVLY